MTTAIPRQERRQSVCAQLRDDLERRLSGIASAAQVGVAFDSPLNGREWLVPCPDGVHSRPGGASKSASSAFADMREVTFAWETLAGCRLLLYAYDSATETLLDSMAELARAVGEIHEVAGREDLLLQELAASWESLAALYESSLDLQSRDSLNTVIDRLLDRCVSAGPEIAAILWVLEGDRYRVIAVRGCKAPRSRHASTGLLGAARRRGGPMVIDGDAGSDPSGAREPELCQAGPIVLVPVRTRQGLEGTLQVWGKEGNAPFESPAVRLLEAIALQAANAIENDRLNHAALEGERMRQEMEIGASIQQHLLLGEHPRGLSGIQIANYMLPAREVGGDFYQFIRHSETCFDAVVGDVMGKGVGAALMGAATKNTILRVIAEAKSGRDSDRLPQPEDIVSIANREMSDQLIRLSSFVTLFYTRFDLRQQTLTYVDAGHAQALHYCRTTGTTEPLFGEGFPLGFAATEAYRESMVPLQAADIVLIHSDGMSEAASAEGELFGAERIRLCLERHAAESAARIATRISDEVTAYRGSRPLEDDLTCLVFRIEGESKGGAKQHLEIAASLDELERMRDWIVSVLKACAPVSISEDKLFSIQLALQEVASNVILHGLAENREQGVAIELKFSGTCAHIEVAYEGIPFRPEDVPLPSFDGSRDHGFGVYLINQLMDRVTYSCVGGCNTIQLTKDLA
jgi:sigma-B regulation protein RsbU (phosphoserine phosphatase)